MSTPSPLLVVTVGDTPLAIHPSGVGAGLSVGSITIDGRSYGLHPLALRRRLTPTELSIASQLVRGDKPEDIAARRGGSQDTVKTHVRRAYSKCSARTANELAERLFRSGELDTNSLFDGKPMFWLGQRLLEIVRETEVSPERPIHGQLEVLGVRFVVAECPALPLRLTEQERRIGQRVVRGLQNKVIAAELDIATNTVATHLKAMFAKCGVRSRKELAVVLRRLGIASQTPEARDTDAVA